MSSTLAPLARYRQELAQTGFVADPGQERAVQELQRVYDALLAPRASVRAGGLLGWFGGRAAGALPAPVRGLYLWGGVGRGKTHVVNGFHDSLPFDAKLRVHFHRFMQRVHAELKSLPGRQDPLQTVAARLAEEARVLTFDEFHVSDITDAMLLGRLLKALFEGGVTLVTTSNIAPDDLYRDGLQRAQFMPAIELLKRHTTVMELGGETDYRLRALEQAEIYHSPLDDTADAAIARGFEAVAEQDIRVGDALEILGRSIATVRTAEGVAWFEFAALCEGPRGAADYIEIARLFHTVFIANVPTFGPRDNDAAARFITAVDEFYDRSVNLVVSAAAPPEALYGDGRHAFAFRRTASRLTEMQSREYLHRSHLP